LGQVFSELGVQTIRLTGGEPLVRRDLPWLVEQLAQHSEVVMTSNGSRLAQLAAPLRQAGMQRINISLDSLDTEQFHAITRTGQLADVLAGIAAAKAQGFAIKLNAVIMKGRNDAQILPLVDFACQHELDISFIEEMPLGNISEHSRALAFMSSAEVLERIAQRYTLIDSTHKNHRPVALCPTARPRHTDWLDFAA
jgi:cyclic pyranopterin phosphate synthase